MSYLLKIDPEQMEKLYYLKEERRSNGDKKSSIAGIVREAIESYTTKVKSEIKKGEILVSDRETKIRNLEMEYAKKKNKLSKINSRR